MVAVNYKALSKLAEVLLYSHRNRRRIRDGEPRTATSTFTQLLGSNAIKEMESI